MGIHAAAGRRHVTVLDVGAGVGLLSLLAARAAAGAGLAADIYAVERDASLARIAQATVEANRVHLPPAVRVHVLHAEVAALAVQDDSESGDGCAESGYACAENGDGSLQRVACAPPRLPERAHVLVHEIFGDDPFSEGVLRTLRHATASLFDPECGMMLPCRVTVHAALVAALPGSSSSSSSVERAALLVPSGGTQARDLSLLDTLAPHKASVDLRALRTSPLISAPSSSSPWTSPQCSLGQHPAPWMPFAQAASRPGGSAVLPPPSRMQSLLGVRQTSAPLETAPPSARPRIGGR